MTDNTPEPKYYVHISTSAQPLQPIEALPGALVPVAGIPNVNSAYSTEKGMMNSGPVMSTADSQTIIDDAQMRRVANNIAEPYFHSRLVKVDGISEAVLNWDTGRIKNFVDLLKLELVPINSNDPLRPELIQYQRIWMD